MSYNGSGTFQINTSGQPVVAGTVISATAFNALTADLATGLSTAITKDGQTTTTARIPFAAGINSTLTTDSSSVSTGSIITAGGVGVAKNLYVGVNANVAGTFGVTGVATFSAAPIYSSLTASSAVATDASKALVSVTNTGTGNNVLATSPTLVTPILGTPQSGTLTNATGLPLTTGVTGVLPEANGGTGTTTGYYGFKNRIINGAMVIDQRNAGASVTATSAFPYSVDRWQIGGNVSSKFTVQQNAGSVTPPAGFTNYLGCTSSSAYTVLSSDYFLVQQAIEGFNVADLGWGTASAQAITVSFLVRSSLTGTFGGCINNSDNSRSYPFTYTISAANTWETKTVTIAGDTTGTWLTTNNNGLILRFGLGVGSTFSGTAGAWSGSTYLGATGATSVVGTNGATFYITGVQLEKGSTATSFDYRPIGTELALCQRYCEVVSAQGSFSTLFLGQATSSSALSGVHKFTVQKRASATLTVNNLANTVLIDASGGGTTAPTAASITLGTQLTRISFTGGSGLVAGNAAQLVDNNFTNPLFIFSSEL